MGLDNPLHIAFLLIVLLLVFGAKRLPEIGRSVGAGMREFKESISGETNSPTITQTAQQQPAPMQQPQTPQTLAQQPAPAQAVPVEQATEAPAQPAPHA